MTDEWYCQECGVWHVGDTNCRGNELREIERGAIMINDVQDDSKNKRGLCAKCDLEIYGQWAVKGGKYWHELGLDPSDMVPLIEDAYGVSLHRDTVRRYVQDYCED